MEQALERMKGLIGYAIDWGTLSDFLPEGWQVSPEKRRSAVASTFAAALELVKAGKAEIRQEKSFAALQLRARQG